MLRKKRLSEAIEHFLAILRLKTATYDSVNDATQHLCIILTELGRTQEADALQALASKAQARLGYSLREDAKASLRQLVRESRNAGQKPAKVPAVAEPQRKINRPWWKFWR